VTRAVEEWIGKTDDTPVPDRVKLRVFQKHGGICHLAKRKIMPGEPWDAEHVIAIINGGENRESNLAPALRDKHPEKTARDMAEKSRTYRKRKSNLGIKKRSSFACSRQSRWKKKVTGEVVLR
jgi:5-methylcytosine-specific restriction protein A